MTTHNITTDKTVRTVTLADNDRWVVFAGVTVNVANSNAFFGVKSFEHCSFIVNGTVETTGNFHTFLLKADHTNVTVAGGGAIQSVKDAIHMLGDHCKVFNSGTIDAVNFGVRIYGESGYLLNDGSITSDHTAVTFGGAKSKVVNDGTIVGLVGVAVNAHSGRFDLLNTGTIEGPKYAYVGNDASEHIRNEGQFVGDVYLRSGADTFISDGGTVTGSVFGGNGNDVFHIDATPLNLVELQNGGTDTVFSSASYGLGDFFENLTLTGSTAIDGHGNKLSNTLTGNSTGNTLTGLGGGDEILAGAGNDVVSGGAGNDMIHGDAGADAISGGAGQDFVIGGAGRDHISGGSGNDQLTGGGARDVFVFANGHGSDTITDFATKGSKHDIVDLADVTAITSFSDLKQHHMHQVGEDVVIKDGTGQIVLSDVHVSDLTARDFLF